MGRKRIAAAAAAAGVALAGGVTAAMLLTEDSATGGHAVLFHEGYESGSVSELAWGGQQCSNITSEALQVERGTLRIQSEVVGEGAHAVRIDLPAAPSSSSSCEALIGRPIGIGEDDYYGLMVRLPQEWREPSTAGWGLGLAQLGFQGIWGSPVALAAHADRVRIVVQSGLCEPVWKPNPHCQYQNGFGVNGAGGNIPNLLAIPPKRFATGVWHELIIHVRRAFDSRGVVETWHRRKGETEWVKTAELRGKPTVQWTAELSQDLIRVSKPVDKVGAYRGPASFPVSVWHDGFTRGRTFEAAQAAFES